MYKASSKACGLKMGPNWNTLCFLLSMILSPHGNSTIVFFLHRFCIFEIFVRHVWLTVPHPTWLRTHCLTTTCPPTGLRHRLWNCLAAYLGETIGVEPASTRRLALNFTSSCRFSTYCTHLTCRNYICQHSAIVETTVKQLPLAFILFDWRCWESPVLHRTALF